MMSEKMRVEFFLQSAMIVLASYLCMSNVYAYPQWLKENDRYGSVQFFKVSHFVL